MHINPPAQRLTLRLLAALLSVMALSLATAAISQAEEFTGADNPNNYECHGHIEAGKPEIPGEEEQQVQYQFACDGPITGYQIESNVEVTGIGQSPLVTYYLKNEPLTDSFSCGGELPGWAVNCVGATTHGGRGEVITGQFSIETPICQEPRVNPLLSVTYASVEKEVLTQAISGPFELGRPWGCKADKYSKQPRLAAQTLPPEEKTGKGKHKKKGKKGKSKAKGNKAKAKAKAKKAKKS